MSRNATREGQTPLHIVSFFSKNIRSLPWRPDCFAEKLTVCTTLPNREVTSIRSSQLSDTQHIKMDLLNLFKKGVFCTEIIREVSQRQGDWLATRHLLLSSQRYLCEHSRSKQRREGLSTYTQIFSPKKWFFPHKKYFPKYF